MENGNFTHDDVASGMENSVNRHNSNRLMRLTEQVDEAGIIVKTADYTDDSILDQDFIIPLNDITLDEVERELELTIVDNPGLLYGQLLDSDQTEQLGIFVIYHGPITSSYLATLEKLKALGEKSGLKQAKQNPATAAAYASMLDCTQNHPQDVKRYAAELSETVNKYRG